MENLFSEHLKITYLKGEEQYAKYRGKPFNISSKSKEYRFVDCERNCELFAGIIRWSLNKEINNIHFLKDKKHLKQQLNNVFKTIEEI